MSEPFESKKSSVYVDPRTPIASIVLMAIALVFHIIPIFFFSRLTSLLYLIPMPLILLGMALHKKNLQLLTGIGSLIMAAFNSYLVADTLIRCAFTGYMQNGYNLFVSLLCCAAYTVTGLHYVLRRPKPGKVAKLILIIPITFISLITMIINLAVTAGSGSINVMFVLLSSLSGLTMNFALMIYTPFREA